MRLVRKVMNQIIGNQTRDITNKQDRVKVHGTLGPMYWFIYMF